MVRLKSGRGPALVMLCGLLGLSPTPVEAEEAEDDGWAGGLGASLTAQTGTTDSFVGAFDANGDRVWAGMTSDFVSMRPSARPGRSVTTGGTRLPRIRRHCSVNGSGSSTSSSSGARTLNFLVKACKIERSGLL